MRKPLRTTLVAALTGSAALGTALLCTEPAAAEDKVTVTTFADAPGYSRAESGANDEYRTGTLKAGQNYVYCRVKGPAVTHGEGTNHWWLKTDLDSGAQTANQWISAYYLAGQGDNSAKDITGKDIRECSDAPPPNQPPTQPPDQNRVEVPINFYTQKGCLDAAQRGQQGGKWTAANCVDKWHKSVLWVTPTVGANDDFVFITESGFESTCGQFGADGLRKGMWKDYKCQPSNWSGYEYILQVK